MYGYHGRVLVVDLTARETRVEPLGPDVLRAFIGGVGLGSYLLYRYCPPGADPLGPDTPLIFACSPLVGTRLTTSAKFAVVTKSPLTGFIGDSLSSSFMAVELKRTGHDALVIVGQAPRPTLLYIEDDDVSFLDAADLMGLTTSATERAVKERLGPRVRVACIGPAGERGVLFASITNDGGRHAGRAGPGAVMGTKNLKALAVLGSREAPVFDAAAVRAKARELALRSLGPATEKYRTLGTLANVAVFDRLGTLPTRNFQRSTFEGAEAVSGEAFHTTHRVRDAHCAHCTIGCEKILVTTDDGRKARGRMEYESAFALGPAVAVADPNVVIRAARLCDEMGMDTISAGVTVAWAMECYQRGLLTPEDTGGLELRFGDGEALLRCLKLIARREGIGDLLAQGSRRAAQALGGGSERWAMHVKGLELPGYEPRSLKSMALGLAVSTRGACHNRSSAYDADFSGQVDRLRADDRRGILVRDGEDFSAVLDSLVWCKFLRKVFDDFYTESAEIYHMVTGWDVQAEGLRRAGERINNLKKLFNIREGWRREDDTLPPRVLEEALPDGVAQGVGLTRRELDMMVASYYRARGWTEEGYIPEAKLRELDLTELVDVGPALARAREAAAP